MQNGKAQKVFSGVVFGFYFLLLVWLVLFKLHINIWEVHHVKTVNLLPFRFDTEAEFSLQLKEMLYNVLIFVPLGVYVHIYKHDWSFFKKIVLCFSVSFLFELLQFVFALGVSDITDLITNTLGGIIGILFYTLLQRGFPKKSVLLVNVLGCSIEALSVSFLAILLLAN